MTAQVTKFLVHLVGNELFVCVTILLRQRQSSAFRGEETLSCPVSPLLTQAGRPPEDNTVHHLNGSTTYPAVRGDQTANGEGVSNATGKPMGAGIRHCLDRSENPGQPDRQPVRLEQGQQLHEAGTGADASSSSSLRTLPEAINSTSAGTPGPSTASQARSQAAMEAAASISASIPTGRLPCQFQRGLFVAGEHRESDHRPPQRWWIILAEIAVGMRIRAPPTSP